MVTLTVPLTLLEYTSRLQELWLWNSLSAHAQINQDKANTGPETREGEDARETGAVYRKAMMALTEKRARELMHNGLLPAWPQDTG